MGSCLMLTFMEKLLFIQIGFSLKGTFLMASNSFQMKKSPVILNVEILVESFIARCFLKCLLVATLDWFQHEQFYFTFLWGM